MSRDIEILPPAANLEVLIDEVRNNLSRHSDGIYASLGAVNLAVEIHEAKFPPEHARLICCHTLGNPVLRLAEVLAASDAASEQFSNLLRHLRGLKRNGDRFDELTAVADSLLECRLDT
jgi:hypothetical protein